jgi:hypothetical protein
MLGISNAGQAIDESGVPKSEDWVRRFDVLAVQLEWMAEAMKRQREFRGIPK